MKKEKQEKKIPTVYHDFVKITGFPFALLYLRPKVMEAGTAKISQIRNGVLITANHIRFDDPILLLTAFWRRRLRFLASKELFRNKRMNFFFTRMLCISVDRDNFNMRSFHKVCDSLKQGHAVVIFPEGKINTSQTELLDFKSGSVFMAYQSQTPILPVFIAPPKKWYHRRVIVVGDPVDVRALCGTVPSMDTVRQATEQLRQKELELKNYYFQHTERTLDLHEQK